MELNQGLVDDAWFFPRLKALMECVRTSLEEAKGPDLCFCGFVVGDQPPPLGLIDCNGKNCGIAWVRVVSVYPSPVFPQPDEGLGSTACATPLAMEVEIGVGRCAPRAEGRQQYPDPQGTFNALRLYMSDQKAMRKAITCCFPQRADRSRGEEYRVMLGAWSPMDAAAGTSGGIWQAWIG